MAIWPNSPYAYLRNHEGYGATSNSNFYLLTEYIKKHFRSRTGENFSAMSPGHWAHLRLLKKVPLKVFRLNFGVTTEFLSFSHTQSQNASFCDLQPNFDTKHHHLSRRMYIQSRTPVFCNFRNLFCN